MQGLIHQLEQLPGFTELRENLAAERPLRAAGLVGGAKAVLAVSLFRRLNRTVLVVASSTRRAEQWYDDLHALLAQNDEQIAPPIRLFPSLPTLLGGDETTDRQIVGQRLDAMESLLRGDPQLVVTPLSALLHRTIPPSAMAGSDLAVEVGQELDPEEFVEQLVELGYARHEPVIMPGQVSRRGGIVDVFPMTSPSPLRVEFWGDAIESIRYFDVNSQRSTKPQDRFTVTVSRESVRTKSLSAEIVAEIARAADNQADRLGGAGRTLEAKRLRAKVAADLKKLEVEEPFDGSDHYLPFLYDEVCTLCDYLSKESVVLIDDPVALGERAAELADEVGQVYRTKLQTGAVLALPAPLYLRYRLDEPLWHDRPTIYLTAGDEPAEPAPDEVAVTFDFEPIGEADGQLDTAVALVKDWQQRGYRLLCTTHQVGRLEQILSSHGVAAFDADEYDVLPTPGRMHIVNQRLSAGFVVPNMRLAVLTDHEVFGWHRARPRAGRSVARRGSTALASLSELAIGDTVVHIAYGIGVYCGLVTREVQGVEREYLQIDYKGTDKLFVPVTELDRVQKYIGPEGYVPELHSLSDGRWRRAAAKAKKKAEAVARDLLELYAKRSKESGLSFGPDTKKQLQMEAAFIYEETPDQLKAINAVKKDMEHADPMDRLLCGDVGFGKTEVAVRAAFKAVQSGYQVGVLVPTTVLAQQHFATFSERLSPFGCEVEVLSRFRSRKEQNEVIERVNANEVNVVIGTHRLLSEDISFHRLGLLIIDEEQRFGVRHKEAIKRLRLNVDVLTMSATPIPRTLNTALIGVRDLSLLQDPPRGRLPVQTQMVYREDDRIREAILREMDRDGQVYFLHNRVQTIEREARRIERLVPNARVGVAHGQMHEDDLEEVMVEMYAGEYDVLVCTTIVESGLDIPNVNTILIDQCDQFGLAQLYQLIGRVGRRERQAYAYLLHRQHKELTKQAEKRLEAITELSELGSGFEIALRDMEIRGAGNLLGVQQSGQVEEVGFEYYTQMLAEALRTLNGETEEEPLNLVSEIDLPVQANLPPFYVKNEQQRIDIYRRLSACRSVDDVVDLEGEVRDRFGRPPGPAGNLFRMVRLRMLADEAGIKNVNVVASRHLSVEFDDAHLLDQKELRIFAKGLSRAARKGGSPAVQLSKTGLTGDLKEPRPWEPVDAAEAMVMMAVAARKELDAPKAATAR